MLKKFTIIFLTFCLSGCALGTNISSLIDSSGTRATKLSEKLKLFHEAYFWGNPAEASQFVVPEKRSSFRTAFRDRKNKEKIVKNEIIDTEFDKGDSEATVHVDVQYFGSPTLVVKTRREIETWEFRSFAGGWFLKDIAVTEDES